MKIAMFWVRASIRRVLMFPCCHLGCGRSLMLYLQFFNDPSLVLDVTYLHSGIIVHACLDEHLSFTRADEFADADVDKVEGRQTHDSATKPVKHDGPATIEEGAGGDEFEDAQVDSAALSLPAAPLPDVVKHPNTSQIERFNIVGKTVGIIAEEENAASDLDDPDLSDLDDGEPPAYSGSIVCLYDQVLRTTQSMRKRGEGNTWRASFRLGMLQVGNRDIAFDRMRCEFKF
eukprot:GHVT01086642.1.p1 GENE.GHVT01086642.1~~GHVT01086642.1.p1  ORF type:complete len:231 (+),score=18.20 GHVT01086642.1:1495-2187(+)